MGDVGGNFCAIVYALHILNATLIIHSMKNKLLVIEVSCICQSHGLNINLHMVYSGDLNSVVMSVIKSKLIDQTFHL